MCVEEGQEPRTREMFCCLGEISRGDGSVILCQGETSVACAVYGPSEARQKHGDLTERAGVEVVLRPRTGLPMVEDKARESRVQAEMTIPYLKCSQKLHLNFEIGRDFLRIWGSLSPKEM